MKYYYIAQAYGSGNYGESTYTGESTSTGSGSNTGAGSSTGTNGDLANTGIYVLAIVSLACFLIFLALLVRLVRRKRQARRTDLPAVIPGEHPVDTPQSVVNTDQAQTAPVQNSETPAASAPQAETPQPPKRIDF